MEEAAGQPHYDNMSKIQANAISDMCSADSSLNSDSKSSLAEAVMTVRWAKPEHAELVLSTLLCTGCQGSEASPPPAGSSGFPLLAPVPVGGHVEGVVGHR